MSASSYSLDGALCSMLADLGIEPGRVLRLAGLPEDILGQCSIRLSAEDYHRVWRAIESEAGSASFPITLSQALRVESFSPPLFAALCSPNLIIACGRIARYKGIVAPITVEVTEIGDQLRIDLQWQDEAPPPPVSLVMTELLSLVTLARVATRRPICPLDISTASLPAPIEPYEQFLGVRLRAGPRHSISFSREDAALPFLTSCETLWNAFEPELRRRLAQLGTSRLVTERVRAVLLEGLPAGLVAMEAVARKLAMTRRTLQRRILAEGETYQNILNDVREKLARHYLQNTKIPFAEISFLLGFDEPNSFHRAFRGWTGSTPQRVRHPQHH